MVNLRKIKITFLEDGSDTTLYQTHSERLKNCHFHVFAIFRNGSHQPSWTAQLHKYDRTPFADHSD